MKKFISLLLLVFLILQACKKKVDDTIKTLDVISINPIIGETSSTSLKTSILITQNNLICYTRDNGLFVSDGSQKLAKKLSSNYYTSIDELPNNKVIAIGFNGLVTIFDLNNNTSQDLSLGSENTNLGCLVSALENGTIFILTQEGSGGKLIKSSDNGISWSEIGIGYTGKITSQGNNLYSVVGTDVYKSIDAGLNFELLTSFPGSAYSSVLSVSPTNELYLSGSNGVSYKIEADGTNPIALNFPSSSNPTSSYFSFGSEGYIYNNGYSFNSGFVPTVISKSTNSTVFNEIIGLNGPTSVSAKDNLVAVNGNAGIYFSQDYGNNWQNLGSENMVIEDITIYDNTNDLCANSFGTNFRLRNNSWYLLRNTGNDTVVSSLSSIPNPPGIVLKSLVKNANGNIFGIHEYENPVDLQIITEYYKTTDNGLNWQKISLEYYPYSFNSKNNFVSPNYENNGIWFSNLDNQTIHAYNLSIGNIKMKDASFNSSDYLYILTENVSTYNKLYKSKSSFTTP